MEYLPEKKRTQKAQVLKKEEKTRQFREYLANNDVVLSMVKCKSNKPGKIILNDFFAFPNNANEVSLYLNDNS